MLVILLTDYFLNNKIIEEKKFVPKWKKFGPKSIDQFWQRNSKSAPGIRIGAHFMVSGVIGAVMIIRIIHLSYENSLQKTTLP